MQRILILLEHKGNQRLLGEFLAEQHQVLQPESDATLDQPFDLGILDGPMLDRLWSEVTRRRRAEEPALLPFLLVTRHQHVESLARNVWVLIDDVITTPVDKAELKARVQVLLRARRLSLDLRLRSDDLQAFMEALTHDLKAPVRIVSSLAEALLDDAGGLDDTARHYLERIRHTSDQARDLIDDLLRFSRLGREAAEIGPVSAAAAVAGSLRSLAPQIEAAEATVEVTPDLPVVRADAGLLKIAFVNMISNAIKYIVPGEKPRVSIYASRHGSFWRLHVCDSGIGIALADQDRLFVPFTRLHGAEQYPGVGLGLSTVRKVADIMDGRVGLLSTPGEGSDFWIELPAGVEVPRRQE